MDIKKTLCLLAFLVLVMGMISAVSAADDGIMLADDSGIGGVSDSREIGSASTDSSADLGDNADSGTNTDDSGRYTIVICKRKFTPLHVVSENCQNVKKTGFFSLKFHISKDFSLMLLNYTV